MAIIASRQNLKEYCLRRLGAPLVQIDITDESMDDAIDDCLSFMQEYYFDGSDRFFYGHQVTQLDIDNKYITLPLYIWGVNEVFNVTNTSASQMSIFDVEYQMRASDQFRAISTGSGGLVYYTQMMTTLSMMNEILNVKKQFRFNRNSDKIYIDMNWNSRVNIGTWIMLDCYAVIDPNENSKFWNNHAFKEIVTARFKMQWAMAYSKFMNIQLPGGVQIDGRDSYATAKSEYDELADDIMNNSSPTGIYYG
jgi:hypothetical protein